MTYLLIISAFSILAAWAHTFAQNKEHAQYVARLHDEHSRERQDWTRERQLLLNRIKPETAQYVPPLSPPEPPPQAIGMDQDDEYWIAQGMTKEKLAHAMMAQEQAAVGDG